MELRRRVPRIRTEGWWGKCTIEDDPESGWSECELLDISLLGVGLEVFGGADDYDLIGHRIVVSVEPPTGRAVSLRLVGMVRDVSEGTTGGIRVGMEFVDLSETEQQIVKTMELLKIGW